MLIWEFRLWSKKDMKILYLKTKFHDFRLNLVAFEIENAACIAYIAK